MAEVVRAGAARAQLASRTGARPRRGRKASAASNLAFPQCVRPRPRGARGNVKVLLGCAHVL
eukprot:scaffold33116_cov67-Phaeocystis_antarctica.AAC.1